MKKYLYIVLLGVFFFSCSNDNGNYDYHPVNRVVIEDLDSFYSFMKAGVIDISPTITQTSHSSELMYSWEIDGHVVSNEKDLHIDVPPFLTVGRKTARLTVTDKENGLSEYVIFTIAITNPFNYGYYFLTENLNNESVLSYYPSSNVKEGEYEGTEFLHTRYIEEYSLGKKPLCISGFMTTIVGLGEGWVLHVLMRENDYQSIITNSVSFNMMGLVSSENYIDQSSGYEFMPEEVAFSPGGGTAYFLAGGRVVEYSGKTLYRPSIHSKEYDWSNILPEGTRGDYMMAFDNLSNMFYTLSPGKDSYAFDRVLTIKNSPDLTGKTIVGAKSIMYDKNKHIIAGDEEELSFIHFEMVSARNSLVSNEVVRTDVLKDNSKAVLVAKFDWFITSGRHIYTSPVLKPSLSLFATVPEECGDITAITSSARSATIIATAYNENSSDEHKGSVIFIDKQSKKMTVFKNVIDKCVSIFGANSNENRRGYGDDK